MTKIATVAALLALLISQVSGTRSRELVEHEETKYEQPKTWTARSDSSCFLHFGFDNESVITNGQSFQSPDNDGLFLTQSGDGNLVVREENRVLWESGASDRPGSYWTELVDEEGFIATYKGRPDKREKLVWTSASNSRTSTMVEPYWVWKPDGRTTKGEQSKPPVWASGNAARGDSSPTQYFLGMDCDYRYVAVFEGTPNDPGDWIWRDRIVTDEPTTSPTSAPTEEDEPFSFYVMGDVPYSNDEAKVLRNQIVDMNEYLHSGSRFMVHLGDFNNPDDTDCKESHFYDIYNILWNGPLPTFVLAGDNDFQECPNKKEAWDNYLDTFMDFEKEWSDYENLSGLLRWDYGARVDGYGDVSRPDMFAFVQEGILFLSLALLNTKDGKPDSAFREREAVSLSWVKRRLEEHKYSDLRGVVFFSHAEESDDLEDFFEEDLRDVFDDFDMNVPVLYLCGDSHKWDIDEEKYWDQFTYVSVDRGACADPLIVEVAPEIDGETQYFEYEEWNQYIVGDGLFRIDRQGGRYKYKDCK